MTQKSKSLHTITIDECTFSTQLHYNLNTYHIGIGTTHQWYNPDIKKAYCEANKNKFKAYYEANKNKFKNIKKAYYEANKDKSKAYYESHRDPNTSRMGSDEFKIKMSCIHQGISRDEWDGFLTDQRYCNLWTESFREMIRERFHRICYLCDKTRDRNLSVHHVNYNKNCLCGSSCEFVPLCQSCHAKTNSNRQYWEDLIMCMLYPGRYFMVDF